MRAHGHTVYAADGECVHNVVTNTSLRLMNIHIRLPPYSQSYHADGPSLHLFSLCRVEVIQWLSIPEHVLSVSYL